MPSGMSFTDLSTDSLVGERDRKGCFVTPIKGVVIFLAAVILATIVGLVVYYEHPDKDKECSIAAAATTTSPPPPDTTTPAAVTDIRLPLDLLPYHYDLNLRPNFYGLDEKDFFFNGSVKISFTVSSGRTPKEIVLHKKKQKQLKVTDGSIEIECLSCAQSEDLSGFRTEEDEARDFFKVILTDGKTLQAGQNYSIYMSFRGQLLDDLYGWYYSSYQRPDGSQSFLVTSQLQATDARKVFPCFDEPALKATFKTTIERPKQLSSWSNTIIEKQEQIDDDWIADYYQTTVRMSTYLLAFVVADFECRNASHTSSGTWVQVCARPNAIDQADFALEIATPIQEYLEEYHNYSYPLPRTIHMAVPDFSAGAMENWGLILYRETVLLYQPNVTSSARKQRIAAVIAHELAHMWFGNLVTPKWWDEIWLNEGFAVFMEYLGVISQFGKSSDEDWKMEDQFLSFDIYRVFPLDSLASSHPVYVQVDSVDQINELFDDITYSKGASVIRMMNYFLGNDTFRLGVADYFKDKAYSAANHTDLFDALTRKAREVGGNDDIDVAEVMNTWILQLGYPVIHCSLNTTTNQVSVSQEQFLLDSSQKEQLPESPFGYQWQVPVNFATTNYSEDNQQWENPKTYWLKSSSAVYAINKPLETSGWFIANIQQRFYYRVNYDDENWDKIIEELLRAHTNINTKNRAQVLDDLFNLGRTGYVDQTKAFDALRYMKEEEEYVPWVTLDQNIGFLYQMLAFSAGAQPLRNFIVNIVEKQYQRLGWNPWSDDHMSKRIRAVVLTQACRFGLKDCADKALEHYENWRNNNENVIHPDLRQLTYCTAIAAGTSDQWDFALKQYNTSNSGSERSTLLRAMACSQETRVLTRYLEIALEEKTIRRQDFATVIRQVSWNPYGRTLVWNFFRHNWDIIFERFGQSTFSLADMVTRVTEHFGSEFQLAELQTFMNVTTDMGSAERAFRQAVDRIMANIAWLETNEKTVVSWLKDYSSV